MKLEDIQKKFCECTKLDKEIFDLKFPISKKDYPVQKQETIKELNRKYGFVPTPIFLVDEMIEMEQDNLSKDSITCDFCAGCGQYSVRLLRYLYNKFQIDVEDFLKNNHYMTELQAENCAALVYTFGPNINLYVGDSMNLKYSDEKDKGILFFDGKKWENKEYIDTLIFVYRNDIGALSIIFKHYDKGYEFIVYLIEDYLEKKNNTKVVEQLKQEEQKQEEGVVEETEQPKQQESKKKSKTKKQSTKKSKVDKPKIYCKVCNKEMKRSTQSGMCGVCKKEVENQRKAEEKRAKEEAEKLKREEQERKDEVMRNEMGWSKPLKQKGV